jgi:hypothetical protein
MLESLFPPFPLANMPLLGIASLNPTLQFRFWLGGSLLILLSGSLAAAFYQ